MKLLRGTREMAVSRDRLHASQLPQLHRPIVRHDRCAENYVLRRSITAAILVPMTASDPRAKIAVGLLDATDSREHALVDQLARLINDVYRTAESGLWRDGADRTTASELAELIAAGQIAVAKRDGGIAGCVRLHDVAEDASEFGMLVADPDQRSTGVGHALVDFAERHSRERGLRAMQLELLVPRGWSHPNKEFLKSWYGRMGYRLISARRIDDAYPHLAPLLATPCDLAVYEKPLRPGAEGLIR
jgi:GNAT superfamily N-acetyltransferase